MRYLVISDLHSNRAAFEAVLADAGTFDLIWCLGDVVGYGPDPNECVDLLRTFSHICVAGNHDGGSVGRLDISDFHPEAQQICQWTGERLTPESKEYILSLPEKLVEGEFTIVHGSPRYPMWEYLVNTLHAAENFCHYDTRFCLVGHTHVPCIFQYKDDGCDVVVPSPDSEWQLGEDRLIINPGGVGQPRDGDERASYAILDTSAGTLTFRRVPYPIYVTQQRMRSAKLPDRQIARLALGW